MELSATSRPGELVRYEAACRAIAEAKAVDEVKLIRDKADAMRAAARIARNKEMEVDAAEIRIRAERRLGEMMAEQKAKGMLNRGTAGTGNANVTGGSRPDPPDDAPITLAEAGIDKHLADRARKMAAVPEEEFEEELQDWRVRVSAENSRVTTRLEKRGEEEIRINRVDQCSVPDSAIVSTCLTCPTCGQQWPEGKAIHD